MYCIEPNKRIWFNDPHPYVPIIHAYKNFINYVQTLHQKLYCEDIYKIRVKERKKKLLV